tara:strand:+ start:289 stop:1293 length:1005 start_codon:yes stop_codon:yes gene_type:complete
VEFTDKIYIDAHRRDFSINAIYLNSSGEIFDPFNGLKDIKNKKLRFIGNPTTKIKEDYLRIIRFCRFYSIFPEKPISQLLQKQIKKQLNNISFLSNKRMKDEFTKILDNSNFDVSLSIIKKLTLDRFILQKKNERDQIMNHCGFKINDFKTIKFIKTLGAYTLKQSNLNLISVIFPHLYNFKQLEDISLRFELSKESKKYFKFLKLIETISYSIEPIFLIKNNDLKVKIEILKVIWNLQNYIYFKNTSSYVRKVPFSWCKLGLFHILPLSLIEKFDILNIELPLFPITRKDINKTFKTIDYNEVNKLLFKAEEFWINKDFCPSSKEIITYLRLN